MPSQMMSTYSIIGYDPRMQELGVAVQSKFLAVGALVPWAEAKVGAVATQARTNRQYGLTVLHELKKYFAPGHRRRSLFPKQTDWDY
jgi:uncharacterized Ntn-hydrolase superfamily protein